ncbi:EpsG family protein [Anaeromassilibacillus senegalensis]|uniref:EpsG family protein n=1 Tax=Anaeromassilibacillus senegalensis TaxID=1673717 RepID=A0ABS9CNI0_9FIRM|nr:EpsG family protein [Anaeromassilibacillus senegalensis]MCF2652708.1 EpsG family protein [Anaeromassilibacillus senegalensis]
MKQLVLLYWGCVFLMYLSQTYYPVETQLDGHQTGKRHFMLRRSDIFMIIVIAWLTCFSFLRTSYNDTVNYIFEWNRGTVSLDEFLASDELQKLGSNPLYDLYRTLVHEITDNYHVFFFFPAVLSCIGSVKLIKRFSIDPAFSLVIFFSIGTYIMYMAAMKQCFAIAILFFSLPYAIDRKYVRYYLLVLFAMLFHTHAFIFLLVPFLFRKPWGKTTWVLFVIAIAAMATYNFTFDRLMNFALSIGVNVADFELFDGHSIHPIRVVVYAIPTALSLVFRKRLYADSTRQENLFANMSIVAVFILMIGLIQGANLFARMAAYYEIALSISFPWMINKIFDKKSAQFLTIVGTICFFGYFLYEFGVSKGFDSGYRAITLWQFFTELLGIG